MTIIYLASKRSEVKKFKLAEILSLSAKNYAPEALLEIESDILHLVDFNLEFETRLVEFLWNRECSDD